MCSERKVPALCLKINVPSALVNGKRIALRKAPVKQGEKTLIPSEALTAIKAYTIGEYTELNEIADLYKVYENMGLIFLDTDADCPSLDTDRDIGFILSVAHSFIFEIETARLGNQYNPATDEERAAFLKTGNQLVGMLKRRENKHPFLFGSQDIFDKLRKIYTSGEHSAERDNLLRLIREADEQVEKLPKLKENGEGFVEPIAPTGYGETEYDVGGRHSHSEGRLNETEYIAFAYMITLNEHYARVAYYNALGVIERLHWGPGHFLNCSGATLKLATVYDWLYEAWQKLGLDPRPIKEGIYTQGLRHGFNSVIHDTCIFPSPQQGTGWRFKLKADNWNSVCNNGMIVGALCVLNDGVDDVITEERYSDITELLGACISSTMDPALVFTQYAPDGSYVESNSYWSYGTGRLAITMAALYDSLGTDLGLTNACGFDKTCYYSINAESAEFVGWNYHDGSLGSQDTACFNPIATISKKPELSAIRENQLATGKFPSALDMLYHPAVRGISVPPLSSLDLDYAMEGIDAFTVRDGWSKGSLYAGMIGGENPAGASHSQIDSGAFVYHNLGINWFCDMGSDYYNSRGIENGLGYFSNYALYRRNAEGNNVLCLKSLPYGQLQGGCGAMTEYRSSDTASYAIIDNTEVYGSDKVKYARRGMLLTAGRKALIVKDEVEFIGRESAFTTAHFKSADITAEVLDGGKRCTLTHKDGKKIYVSLLGEGKIEIMSCQGLLDGTAPAEGEYPRDDFSRLVVLHDGVEKINTAFVIEIDEASAIKENIDMEMWKTL